MLKKDIAYVDYNGTTRTDPFYFNISPADIIDMEVEASDYSEPDEKGDTGYKAMINQIVAAKDIKALMKLFKDLLRRSYGVKTEDGKHFYKGDEVFRDFESSPAYSALIMELLGDTDKAVEFVNAIFPSEGRVGFEVVPGSSDISND